MTIFAIEVIEEHTALIYVEAATMEEAEQAALMVVQQSYADTELDTRNAYYVGVPSDLKYEDTYWDNEAGRWEEWKNHG